MDDFLLIVTPEWQEIENFGQYVAAASQSEAQIAEWIATNDYGAVNNFAEYTEMVPLGTVITQARMFNTGDADNLLRFWIVTE
jgi:hypothetical protein